MVTKKLSLEYISQRKHQNVFRVASLLFLAFFIGLTVPMIIFHYYWGLGISSIFFIGFEILFIGIAYEITESILALHYKPTIIPKLDYLNNPPSTALLITLCDDVIPAVLERLSSQTYPNYDVFVLDDSQDPSQRAIVDNYDLHVIRRGSRRAFKAGNLNYWLDRYGSKYKYFVILDSDSIIPKDFITRMVQYAEHPSNENISIFQSKILSWNTDNMFSRILGGVAPIRQYVLERVANRTGMLLSWGHNNLNKTDHILQVGGFHEQLSAEDTTLSLMLSSKGFKIQLVDIVSYDSEPEDMLQFLRRTIRWAKQSVEIFRLPWKSSSIRLKLLVCYHLYSYLIINVYLGLLLITAWAFNARNWSTGDQVSDISSENLVLILPWLLALIIISGSWILQIMLRSLLAKKAGVSFSMYIAHTILSNALMYFVALPVGVSMLKTALGEKTEFTPTNLRSNKNLSLGKFLRYMLPSILYCVIVLVGVILRNRYLLFSFNFIWLLLWTASPLVLWLIHKNNQTRENLTNELFNRT